MLSDKFDVVTTIIVEQFISELCNPMKQVELWGKAQRAYFGLSVCDKLPAFARVMAMLVTERGRLATMHCVRSKIPLSVSGSDVGIDDCKAVVEELQRLKAGPKPETTSGGSGFPPQGASEGSSGGGLPPSAMVAQKSPRSGQSMGAPVS